MSRGPGWLFVAGVAVFALLGLLAGSPPPNTPPPSEAHRATDAAPPRRPSRRPDTSGPQPVERVSTRSPAALARSWAEVWANWSSRRLGDQLRALAQSASPALVSELRDARSATQPNGALASALTGSRGVVVVVHVERGDARRRLVVVTREALYGPSGLDPAGARYRIYVGIAVRDPRGDWEMAKWDRQP